MAWSPAAGSTARGFFARRPEARLALLRACWPVAVGRGLEQRTEVVTLEGETLRVRVPDGRWRKVLHRMQPEILQRLRAVAGELAPRRLGYVEGPVSAPAPGASSPEAAAPTGCPPAVAAAADAIVDPELRARFVASAGRYLAAQEGSKCAKP